MCVRARRPTHGIPVAAITGGNWVAEWSIHTVYLEHIRNTWRACWTRRSRVELYTIAPTPEIALSVLCNAMRSSGTTVFVNGRPSMTLESMFRFHPV